jgi:7-keto-8-aminopelargonate synthetase-like enzyme
MSHNDIMKELDTESQQDKEIRALSFKSEQGRRDYSIHRQLKFKYGITLQKYNEMLREQGGKCAICGSPPTVFEGSTLRRLHVDHNHNTGQIRELLCHNCNQIIGKCGESIDILSKIADYIEKWNLLS